jgi:putative transcriptional regulator
MPNVDGFSAGLSDSGTACAGALLVATPLIDEPIFRRTAILLLDHNADGSLGVVINDESELDIAELVPEWQGLLAPRLANGGPVQTDAGVAVAELRDSRAVMPDGLRPVGQGWAVVDLDGEPDNIEASVNGARLFLGYSGWGAGQLDGELRSGSWWVVPSQPGDLAMSQGRHRLEVWREVLWRQPNELRFAASFPDDPEMN